MAIHLCHVPSPPSSLWTAVGGQEEGAVLFKSQFLSCLGLTESFSPSMGDRGSAWGRADSLSPRRRLRECVSAPEQFGLDTVWEFLLPPCLEGHSCGSGFWSWVDE